LDDPGLGSPDEERAVHEDHGNRKGADDHGLEGFLKERPDGGTLHQDPEDQKRADAKGDGTEIRKPDLLGKAKKDEGPEHVKLAVSEIHDFENAKNQRETRSHKGIDSADQDAVGQVLEKHIEFTGSRKSFLSG
jgi:hypothetical protein